MKQAQYSFTQIRRLEQIKFHLLFLGFEIQEWRFEGNHPYIHRYNDCTGENQRNRWKLGGGNIKMKKRKEGRRKKANKGSEMWTTPSHEWGPWSAPAQALLVPSRTSNRGICTSTTTWKSKPRNQENQENQNQNPEIRGKERAQTRRSRWRRRRWRWGERGKRREGLIETPRACNLRRSTSSVMSSFFPFFFGGFLVCFAGIRFFSPKGHTFSRLLAPRDDNAWPRNGNGNGKG